jgi:hypothetical protein
MRSKLTEALRFPNLMVLALLAAPGCVLFGGNDSPDTDDDGPGPFVRVVIENGVDLSLVHGRQWEDEARPWHLTCTDTQPSDVKVLVADDALKVTGGDADFGADCTLELRAEPLREIVFDGNGDLDVDSPIRGLEQIEVHGNGDITFAGIVSDTLTIETGGNGTVEIGSVDVADLDLTTTGRGDTRIEGTATTAIASVRGIGDLVAVGLTIQDLYIEVTGAGNASVFVTGTIDGFVSGDGNLDVWGNPTGAVEQRGAGQVVFHDALPPAR